MYVYGKVRLFQERRGGLKENVREGEFKYDIL
jgi:hypothetical protein